MAKPVTQEWFKLSIWVGDGASPEDFTRNSCGLTSTNFEISAQMTEQEVPDCDDPTTPPWVERVVRSLSGNVGGEGLMDETADSFWRDWALSGLGKNLRIVVDKTVPGYFYGFYKLSRYRLVGSLEEGKITTSLEIQSDGPVAWQAGSP